MKGFFLIFLFTFTPISSVFGGEIAYGSLERLVRKASSKVSPAVIQLQVSWATPPSKKTLHKSFFSFPPAYFMRPPGPVTGVIISPDGLVLTSHYNVFRSVKITLLLSDGRSFAVKKLGVDLGRDLALLQILHRGIVFPFVSLQVKHQPRPGHFVCVLGRGRNLKRVSLSLGIISGIHRWEGGLLQTDSKINYSNVGGPLINLYGELLGIVTRVSHHRPSAPMGQNSGVGFAVPSEIIRKILADLKNDRRFYITPPPSLGAVLARSDLKKGPGLQVKQVLVGTPAFLGGIQKGDFLLSFRGKKIYTYTQLLGLLKGVKKSGKFSVQILRRGKVISLQVPLVMLPAKLIWKTKEKR